MDLSAINPVILIAALIGAATPILLAAIGELVVERAGVLNLGVEGMMITGAVCGFVVAANTGSPWLGFIGAAIGGALLLLALSSAGFRRARAQIFWGSVVGLAIVSGWKNSSTTRRRPGRSTRRRSV